MGAWNEHPFGNDDAMDWLSELCAKIAYTAKKASISEDDYQQIRAAVEVTIAMARHGATAFQEEDVACMRACLESMLENTSWINDWNKPKAIQKEIKRQIRLLNKYFPTDLSALDD